MYRQILWSSAVLASAHHHTQFALDALRQCGVTGWCAVFTADPEELGRLQVALSASRVILSHVDHAVRECDSRRRLADLQKRLDTRPLENCTDQVAAQYKVSIIRYT